VSQVSGGMGTTVAGVKESTGGALNLHVEQGIVADDAKLAIGGSARGRISPRMQALSLAPSLLSMWNAKPFSVYGRFGPQITFENFDDTFYLSPGAFGEVGVGVPLHTSEEKDSTGNKVMRGRLLLTLSGTLEYDIRATKRDDAFGTVLIGLASTKLPGF